MSNTLAFLRATFREALVLGVGGPAMLVGCGDDGGIEHDLGFVELTCEDEGTGAFGQPRYFDGIQPAEPVDYMVRGSSRLSGGPVFALEEIGTPCVDVEDRAACLTALGAPFGPSNLVLGEIGGFVLNQELRATRGDELVRVLSTQELLTFLAPIDTPADAVLLAASAGYTPRCTRSGSKPLGAGYGVQLFTHPGCDGRRRHLLYVSSDGQVFTLGSHVEREPDPFCTVGRRPIGIAVAAPSKNPSVAAYFARAAELEAASVYAFEFLRSELTAHGAPSPFAARARAAAADELRHTQQVARLSRGLGGKPSAPRVLPLLGVRSLESIAIENAVEGCVRETYGALVALHQAQRSRDPRTRRLYKQIAGDEARHAALAWDIAHWAQARSGTVTRRRVATALDQAVEALEQSTREQLPTELAETAGLPQPDGARLMLHTLERRLWRRFAAGLT